MSTHDERFPQANGAPPPSDGPVGFSSALSPETIAMLGKSVEGIQSSFGAVYNTLASNLRQSLEMTQTMNAVMEQVLVSSLKIRTTIIPNSKTPSRPELALTLANTSAIPIPRASLGLIFESVGDSNAIIPDFSYDPIPHTSTRISMAVVNSQKSIAPPFLPPAQYFILPPQTSHTEHCLLHPPQLCQYNVTVRVSFPSPGTEKLLRVEAGFGVYLVDQLTKITYPPQTETREAEKAVEDLQKGVPLRRMYPAGFLRKIMRTSGLVGIAKGGWVGLESDEGNIRFSLRFLDVDEAAEAVEVGAFARLDDANVRTTALGVMAELDGLIKASTTTTERD